MLSEPFLSPQLVKQHVETWNQIDPRHDSLLGKKLRRAHRKTAAKIKKQALTIRFANRLSCNPAGTELQIQHMWKEEIKRLTEECYAILCREWEEVQGNKRTAIFVRAASAQLLKMIERWGRSANHAARVLHRRRGGVDKSLEGSYTDLTKKLREDWKEKLDIEAGDLHKQETAKARVNLAHEHQQGAHSVASIARGRADQGSRVLAFAVQPVNERESFVRPLLENKGWSTNDWAVNSNVDFHTADSYLKNKKKTYRSTRKKLAESLGIKPENLPN